jgi:hypothetical protein
MENRKLPGYNSIGKRERPGTFLGIPTEEVKHTLPCYWYNELLIYTTET